ncbi:unnamed protein product [Schistosoma margrebowiei]|uniref:Uncharacterized protein n=1 Tax=Schistosoma margrebowiei TaxID=48269 RepID=A0A183MU90_9TREM|nr:unnamed protein product [Schistosoma margrebowiei]
MNDNWKWVDEALTSTCQELLCSKKHHHKDWISMETMGQLQESRNKETAINNSRTRTEKFIAQAEYPEANKQVKRSTRADKQIYMKELSRTIEKAEREGNMRQLYDTTKRSTGKCGKPEKPVKDKASQSLRFKNRGTDK